MKALLEGSELMKITLVESGLIDPSPANMRVIAESSIDELAESVKAQGLLQAIIVRKHPKAPLRYELVAGERRFRACKKLGYEEIPSVIRELTDAEAHDITVTENLHREDLTPIQEARSIQTLIDDGRDPKEIADRLGKPVSWVVKRVKLKDLSEKWVRALSDEESGLSMWSAAHLELIARYDVETQDEIYEEFIDEPTITVKTLCDYLGRLTCKLTSAPWKLGDDTLLPDVGSCEICEKRTSTQPDLFDEFQPVKKDDRCLDKDCWKKKLKAFHTRKLEELKEKNDKIVIFDKSTYNTALLSYGDELKRNAEHHEYKYQQAKKSDPEAIPAYIIDGPQAGKVNYVKIREEYKDSAKVQANTPEATLEEKMKGLEKRRVIRFLAKCILVLKGEDPDSTNKKKLESGKCQVCGCTEYDCSQCVKKTGEPCSWVNSEKTLCSACEDEIDNIKDKRKRKIAKNLGVSEVLSLAYVFGVNAGKWFDHLDEENSYEYDDHWKVYGDVAEPGYNKQATMVALATFPQIINRLQRETEKQSPEIECARLCCRALYLDEDSLWDKSVEEIPVPKSWAKLEKKKKSPDSAERKYIYKGSVIFVSPGLGNEQFGTFRNTDAGSGIKRIVTKDMPMVSSREEAQRNLDTFAEEHELTEVEPEE